MLNRLSILFRAIWGYMIKFKIDLLGIGGVHKLQNRNEDKRIIVSLTSYGRRVESVVYYTLVSLLKQRLMPDKIVLWLDNDNWCDNNLPPKISKLKQYGVDILYCKDIRSYKKLVPTLDLYPNDIIITVDDDVYYSNDLVLSLYNSYLNDMDKISCLRASVITFKNDGTVAPYNEWLTSKYTGDLNIDVFPVGVGGVLYPPNSLHKDVCREDLFMTLCPAADDLWFWMMANLNHIKHKQCYKKKPNYVFDDLYKYFHKGSALTHFNYGENKNDVQLGKILEYYHTQINKL